MKPIGQTLFQELRQTPGFQNCIIAGGFIRDSICNKEYTDVDVFVPIDDIVEQEEKTEQGIKFPSSLSNPEYSPNTYSKLSLTYEDKWDLKYHDILDVDIMTMPVKGGPDFGETVVNSFDYGINMCWYDGEIHTTKEFDRDREFGYITLQRLNRVKELPFMMKRFFKLQSKFKDFVFQSKVKFETEENRNNLFSRLTRKEVKRSAYTLDNNF